MTLPQPQMPIDWDAFEQVMKSINVLHSIRKMLPADHPNQREAIERIQNFEQGMVAIVELNATSY
jgi:hypothetical protein